MHTSAVANVDEYRVDLMNELGSGTFGTVYKGCTTSNKSIAIKRVSKSNGTMASSEALTSYYLKKNITHKNIITVYDVKTCGNFMWIMMEFCNLGDLNHFFNTHNMLVKYTLVKIELMTQIISGITFLHSKRIVHRDIKPRNILLTKSRDQILVKVGDFGLSKILDPDSSTSAMSSNVGTLIFKAPEFWDYKPGKKVRYHRNVDIYSAGLTFTAMLQAQPDRNLAPKAEGSLTESEAGLPIGLAVKNRRAFRQPEFNVVENQSDDDTMTKAIKQLIRGMTCLSPEQRLSSSEVQQNLEQILLVSCEQLKLIVIRLTRYLFAKMSLFYQITSVNR